MNLGISGRTAVVCATSKELGKTCASALAIAGVNFVLDVRGENALQQTVDEIRSEHGFRVTGDAKRKGVDFDTAWEARQNTNPSKRYGKLSEFGATCSFMVSEHTGYMTGKNILLDGGAYP
jgi:NAD(P)-dependent dehydrogenase (short-subunit alcohol dehydrogenase family)